ncbi:MAG: 3-isopropylmalate dehydrogenase [Chloroflexi bacterium]|nr:3-isopropylmalate dehydrogenase [Chloroflexota bacterium]
MEFDIALLPGDGIGVDVTVETVKVLEVVGEKFGHRFRFHQAVVGGVAIDATGTALPQETLDLCKRCDAVLLGAVGGPKWDDPRSPVRPEQGLLGLRKGLGLFANLRPVKIYPCLVNSTTIKQEVVSGVDLLVVRELTGGIYFGKPSKRWVTSRGRRVVDTLAYSEREIERILRIGFELARGRRRKLTSVDKANVLTSSRLWREIAMELAPQYPDVSLEHILVDACSMFLIRRPATFDVIVTENLFGDILTDEASMLVGSMGMLPSASLGSERGSRSKGPGSAGRGWRFGMYEPIHGSAPSRAGQDLANPIASILSAALMLRYSLGLEREALAIEAAVEKVLEDGYRTYDIMEEGKAQVGTRRMGDLVALAV